MFLFFFKQKTAYEMRISDWSSDVCSSDLSDSTTTTSPPATPASPRPVSSGSSRTSAPPTAPTSARHGSASPPRSLSGPGPDRAERPRAEEVTVVRPGTPKPARPYSETGQPPAPDIPAPSQLRPVPTAHTGRRDPRWGLAGRLGPETG